jgi:anti-sigma regulatory factor (Ser/Thr protein kinase)
MAAAMPPIVVQVEVLPDIRTAEQTARRVADSMGFCSQESEAIALVATELASNLIKHAGGGIIRFAAATVDARGGIQIESEDYGPGIVDFERAVTDGFSTTGSLGTGLGAVHRLMDRLELRPTARGTHILCERWLRPRASIPTTRWLEFGVATRARRQQRENGDSFIICQRGGDALVGVIDGLGHGSLAQRAAQAARQYVQHHFDHSLEDLFRGAGRACRATRGVVMALGRFDFAQKTLSVANIGNVEVRVLGSPSPVNLRVRRGIVGLTTVEPVTTVCSWTSTNVLVMHSDGVRPHWDWKDFAVFEAGPAEVIAGHLLSKLGGFDDDATVLVVKGTAACQ